MNQDWLVEIEEREERTIEGLTIWEAGQLLDERVASVKPLLQAYKHLIKAIEEAPHHSKCRSLKDYCCNQGDYSCNCWKSQALNFNPTEVR